MYYIIYYLLLYYKLDDSSNGKVNIQCDKIVVAERSKKFIDTGGSWEFSNNNNIYNIYNI